MRIFGLLLIVSLTLAGCVRSLEITEGPIYPELATANATLDVQVARDVTELAFTNTTAATLGPGRLWVNRWYSRECPAVPVGQSIRLDLYEFKDRYGTPFRGGGFFASERPDRVVLVELEPTSSKALQGLVVVKGEE
jgi:hypothetical protein